MYPQEQQQPSQGPEVPRPLRNDEESPEASTSGRDVDDEELKWPTDAELEASGRGAPLLAAGIGVMDVKRLWHKWSDRIFYDDILPPTGSQQISYARLLHLLSERKIKRITLLADGKVAIVEVPVMGFATDWQTVRYDRRDTGIKYGDEFPEWQMEKHRFYCELPGDMWEDGYFMSLVKMAQPYRGEDNRRPYEMMLQEHEVYCELSVVDPSDQSMWLNQNAQQLLPILALLALRGVVGIGAWLVSKLGRSKTDPMQELADELGSHRAKEFNVGVDPKRIGVKYEDVAGIDHAKGDIRVAMDMLLGSPAFRAMGAKPYKGILLEGPPGTGKTYLAKAMAGEAGVPFFSANGSEFVEMFQGVAASRIRSLFKAARKVAPAIIFIDEIDAIGKARGTSSDSGSREREQGLLQLLTEMDGFQRDDQVLVVGATNRAAMLDDALMRPGRFDRCIYMGKPGPADRLKILQVHARNKRIDRGGDEEYEEDALLHKVAELAIGYSGAELANLLNESAILAVRRSKEVIDMPIILEAMEKVRLGLKHQPLPASEAKTRLGTLMAARAVVLSLSPGVPPIESITILPRGGVQGRTLFAPMEEDGCEHELYYEARDANGRLFGTFDYLCRLLVPLYAARVAEEVFYGREGVTLITASEVARAGDLAEWLVRGSSLHPAFQATPMLYDMDMGGWDDPTTKGLQPTFEPLIQQLLKVAHSRAMALVRAHKDTITAVAEELLTAPDETVSGERIRQLLKVQPLAELDATTEQLLNRFEPQVTSPGETSFRSGGAGVAGEASFHQPLARIATSEEDLRRAAEVIAGRLELKDFASGKSRAELVREQMRRLQERQEAMEAYASSDNGAPFPPPPLDEPDFEGMLLSQWVTDQNVIDIHA